VVEIMEEYISKNMLMKFLDNLRQPKNQVHPAWLTKGFKYITIDEVIRVASERPPEDVVEREKIDKAVKELERYSTSFEYANRHDLAGAVDYCIGVIEREMGKSVDTSPIK
jgi:hypothetical protein